MKKSKKIIIAIICLVVVAALLFGAYMLWGRPQPAAAGPKRVAVEIVHGEDSKIIALQTEQEFLRGALEDEGLISGTESEYGLFVTTVDGYTADDSKQEWWCFTKGGEELFTGVDTTPIENGDQFEITLTEGY